MEALAAVLYQANEPLRLEQVEVLRPVPRKCGSACRPPVSVTVIFT